MILDEWIPGVPRPQGNPQQITATFSRYPKPTIEHRNEVIRHLGLIWDGKPPLNEALKLTATFWFPRPKSHYRTGRFSDQLKPDAPTDHIQAPDWDKLLRLVSDALTIARVIEDDRLIVDGRGRKRWTQNEPGTHLWLQRVPL